MRNIGTGIVLLPGQALLVVVVAVVVPPVSVAVEVSDDILVVVFVIGDFSSVLSLELVVATAAAAPAVQEEDKLVSGVLWRLVGKKMGAGGG